MPARTRQGCDTQLQQQLPAQKLWAKNVNLSELFSPPHLENGDAISTSWSSWEH